MAGNIRPRRKPGAKKVKKAMARGFPHPVIKTLLGATVQKGYVTRRGTPDYAKLEELTEVSSRMLRYAAKGANLSLRAVQQWADVVGVDLCAKVT